MAKRGKTPSLISGNAGTCNFISSPGKRHCKRCDDAIDAGCNCVEVNVPATMGHRTYCIDCFREMLAKSREDLDDLESQVDSL